MAIPYKGLRSVAIPYVVYAVQSAITTTAELLVYKSCWSTPNDWFCECYL